MRIRAEQLQAEHQEGGSEALTSGLEFDEEDDEEDEPIDEFEAGIPMEVS